MLSEVHFAISSCTICLKLRTSRLAGLLKYFYIDGRISMLRNVVLRSLLKVHAISSCSSLYIRIKYILFLLVGRVVLIVTTVPIGEYLSYGEATSRCVRQFLIVSRISDVF